MNFAPKGYDIKHFINNQRLIEMFDAELPLQLRMSDTSGYEFNWGVMITEKGAIYEGFFNEVVREGLGR